MVPEILALRQRRRPGHIESDWVMLINIMCQLNLLEDIKETIRQRERAIWTLMTPI
jgi:hypothetical protein